MRIGILYMGNESDRIWGGGVITYYLAEALKELGHDVWRVSGTEKADLSGLLDVDFLVSEGVPASLMPREAWKKSRRVVYWWLSNLFYDEDAIARAPFDGIATNAAETTERLSSRGVPACTIELAAPACMASAIPRPEYASFCTYLGGYPHKNQDQLDAMLRPATEFGLTIWGRGWALSPFRAWYRGVLPLLDIGRLYRSSQAVLAMTEERQKSMGMVNNRIFEAIACGAVVISDPHPFLSNHELGPFINFAANPEEVRAVLQRLVQDSCLRQTAAEGQRFALAHHTYRHRAEQFLRFFEQICN